MPKHSLAGFWGSHGPVGPLDPPLVWGEVSIASPV